MGQAAAAAAAADTSRLGPTSTCAPPAGALLASLPTAACYVPLADLECIPGVVVPDVIPEGSSSDVLVLSWVEGERLTDSSAADVRQLCNTLLSAYLHQVGGR